MGVNKNSLFLSIRDTNQRKEGGEISEKRTRGGVAEGGLEPALGPSDVLLGLLVHEIKVPGRTELICLVYPKSIHAVPRSSVRIAGHRDPSFFLLNLRGPEV